MMWLKKRYQMISTTVEVSVFASVNIEKFSNQTIH